MSWIQDLFDPKQRAWEDIYRNRWAHDKMVRTTHGVNCTGSCSWNVHVKNGIITWETQALDYPIIDPEIPPHEPRGCQRGISSSWYIYSPLRVKYPYVRGALLDLWREAKQQHPSDSVAAWSWIVGDSQRRQRYQTARGKGGFRRVSWSEANEIATAANIHTIRRHGPDRIVGFSPIPAMSMASYAAGARFLQLMGGVCLSFYDWYCDLPPASPEIWGEQTDVAESADWYHSRFIALVGSNVLMTRTPDAHFLVEARHRGAKVVSFSPDYSQSSKVADQWVPIHQGQDGAFWMAVTHVIFKEFYKARQVPYFQEYVRRFTDAPFLVVLKAVDGGAYSADQYLRADQIEASAKTENPQWKMFVWDETDGELRMPQGTIGHRWQKEMGQWNLKWEDAETGRAFRPALLVGERKDAVVSVEFPDFSDADVGHKLARPVPVRSVKTQKGDVYVTTVMELLLAQYGVGEGEGDWPSGYEDQNAPYTPSWQEKFTGVSGATVIEFARQWARTAEETRGRCSVIIGAGANHWYHNNLIYRSPIVTLMMTGCVGVNGGGLNHYVGQEKLAPQASWAAIAFGTDWGAPPRLMNAPSFHYMHSSQWRYDEELSTLCPVRNPEHPFAQGHPADKNVTAVRNGWLPCYPQFNRSNLDVVREAETGGARSDEEIVAAVVARLKERDLKFSMEDPDNPESYPRVWYIWRGNAIMSSAKGHEYFLKHYLGTHHNAIHDEIAKDLVKEVIWHDKVDPGKMDLVVDLNFRMDTSALYSDIILPAATFYEKEDLNSTDLHSFIHPLQAAAPPAWEAKSDWDIFRGLAAKMSEMAPPYFPQGAKDIVLGPLQHDTPAEIAQPQMKNWISGECDAVPGTTMPHMKVVTRDYKNLHNRFVSLGRQVREQGLAMHGLRYPVDDVYDEAVANGPCEAWGGERYPSLRESRFACEAILAFAPETNGELAYRTYKIEAVRTGIDHSHEAEETRSVRMTFDMLAAQPRRLLTTPFWSGITRGKRTYSAYCQNVEGLIPWRTLTGRQHLYLDHEAYVAYGENLPTYKLRADLTSVGDLQKSSSRGTLVLNFLTPHGKWQIHSTFGDNLRMRTLSRGVDPVWINTKDAATAGISDGDWVEVYNDHGALCTLAIVSARIPPGICLVYHSPERTTAVPKSSERGNRRAGGHNSMTRVRLKPLLMIGGYAQFTYAFNYWGPTGVNRDTYVRVKKLDKVVW